MRYVLGDRAAAWVQRQLNQSQNNNAIIDARSTRVKSVGVDSLPLPFAIRRRDGNHIIYIPIDAITYNGGSVNVSLDEVDDLTDYYIMADMIREGESATGAWLVILRDADGISLTTTGFPSDYTPPEGMTIIKSIKIATIKDDLIGALVTSRLDVNDQSRGGNFELIDGVIQQGRVTVGRQTYTVNGMAASPNTEYRIKIDLAGVSPTLTVEEGSGFATPIDDVSYLPLYSTDSSTHIAVDLRGSFTVPCYE